MIDHVNNLKLQHLVELSKLGDGCVDLEREISDWLTEHDVVFNGQTIPFVLMPHFVSPGQLRHVRHAVGCLSRVLNRSGLLLRMGRAQSRERGEACSS